VRPQAVVIFPPLRQLLPHIIQREEDVHIQTLVTAAWNKFGAKPKLSAAQIEYARYLIEQVNKSPTKVAAWLNAAASPFGGPGGLTRRLCGVQGADQGPIPIPLL